MRIEKKEDGQTEKEQNLEELPLPRKCHRFDECHPSLRTSLEGTKQKLAKFRGEDLFFHLLW